MTTTAEPGQEIGRARLRKEDARLITGRTRWTDNLSANGLLHMAIARCPYPHARIRRIDAERARALEGVEQILLPADVRAATEPLTVLRPVPGAPALPYYALAQDVASRARRQMEV